MNDDRYKEIMEGLGMPNSRSLLMALQQVANEVAQEYTSKFAQTETLKKQDKKFLSLRKLFYCSRDVHHMDYDSGLLMDIGNAGTCSDCGYRTEGVIWPRMPEVKKPYGLPPIEPLPPKSRTLGPNG